MSRMPSAILVVLALGAVSLSACTKQESEVVANEQVPAAQQVVEASEGEGEEGGGGGGDFASATVVWEAENIEYTSSPSEAPAGEVTIGLAITGGLPHNVVFEGFNGDEPLVEGPGEGEYAATVNLEAGDYTFYCSIAGHRAAGMEGQITVA